MTKNKETLGDQPIEQRYINQMRAFADTLDDLFNKGEKREIGFCLMIFSLREFDGRANYVSNAKRSDVVKLLKEQVRRFEDLEKKGK